MADDYKLYRLINEGTIEEFTSSDEANVQIGAIVVSQSETTLRCREVDGGETLIIEVL
jgi:hypothetical protein